MDEIEPFRKLLFIANIEKAHYSVRQQVNDVTFQGMVHKIPSIHRDITMMVTVRVDQVELFKTILKKQGCYGYESINIG